MYAVLLFDHVAARLVVHRGARLEEADVWVGRVAVLGIEWGALKVFVEGEAVDFIA
jgi:hypothetical protein